MLSKGLPQLTKPRVSIVTSLPPHKGISFYSAPLVEALGASPNVYIDVIAFRRLYPSRLYPGGSVAAPSFAGPKPVDVRVRSMLDILNPVTWIDAAFGIRGEIVHAQWWSHILAPLYLTVLGLARLRHKKVLLTIHNVSAHEPSLWKRLADRCVMSLAHHYIVHAPENADALQRLLPGTRGRISVIPMGPQSGSLTGLTKVEARARLGISRKDKVVLFFGNIRPYKRLDIMLTAFEALRFRLPSARLMVVGQPWAGAIEVDRALKRASHQPGVTLKTEYVSEVETEAYFAAADLLAFPYSGFESQSAAASKALAFGKAMIVSRTGGLPNLVRDDRALVEPADWQGLANKMELILTDASVRKKLERDSATIARSVGWNQIVDQTVELYRQLAA